MKKLLSRLSDYNFFKDALLRKIFIVSISLALVLFLSNLLFILPSFNRYMMQEKKEHAINIARHLSSFVTLKHAPPTMESLPVGLLEQAVRYKNDFGLIKLKVFSSVGEIIFSTDPEDNVGIQKESFLNAVLAKGSAHANVVRKNVESYEGEMFPVDVVETYVPLMLGDDFLGVLEIYYDITQRKKEFVSLLTRSFIILLGMGAGLLIIIVITLIRENNIITGRKKAEEALAWESDVNEALSELYVPLISSSSSDQEIARIVLEQGKRLTKSERGYVSSLDPRTSHSMGHTLTGMMKKIGKLSEKQAESFSANSQETDSFLQTNKDKKTPSKRLLSVPVMLGEQLVGQIALSDKKDDYTQRDLEAVRRLAYLYALAIQRKWAEEALQQAHDTLERRVEERTRELVETNVRLSREVEEHKQTEEELLQAKETLQSVFDGISDPLVMLDNDLSIVMLNEAAKKFYQVADQKELLGKVCYEALKEGSKPCEGCEVPRAIESGKIKMFERKGYMDPERLENVVVYPVKGKTGSGSGAILHIRDITDQKQFEKQLIQSEKLASLGLLVSSIAHEINNPNSFISFNTPILRDYLEELMPIVDIYAEQRPDFELFHMPYSEFREDLYKLLDNIEHGATRINSVVAHLREFSRGKDRREEKWIDLKSVVDKSLAMCETKVRKTVKSFVKEIPGDLSSIYSDPYALEQILINLLLNAAQASDKKDSRVALSVATGNTWLDKTIIQVSDNGRGMDPKTREHIFDPFFSTKAHSDGTGLGLYITHNLVSSLRGRIEVESQQGEGSIFKVILPDKERRKEKKD